MAEFVANPRLRDPSDEAYRCICRNGKGSDRDDCEALVPGKKIYLRLHSSQY